MYTIEFFKEVIRRNKSTGALVPSSRQLAETITGMANLQGKKSIVEFGPGTGVFTEVIMQAKDPDAHFIAMEVNPEFVKLTRERCPGATVIHDSAENTMKYLQEAGHDGCDVIISGLPWARFEDDLQDKLLEATYTALKPGGEFITFVYNFSKYLPSGRRFFYNKLAKTFPQISMSRTIWQNIPPCVVYKAQKNGK